MKLVCEDLNSFVRNQDPKKTLGLGIIEIIIPNSFNINTDYIIELCKNNNVQYEILKVNKNVSTIKFVGTKEQLLPIIAFYDDHVRDIDELREDLRNWNGASDELISILT